MSRLVLFAAAMALAFATAFMLGDAIDPGADDGASDAHGDESAHREAGRSAGAAARLIVADARFEPGVNQKLEFHVVDVEGHTVRDFDFEHGRRMHVIAVRRDLTGYQHVHPRRTPAGGWAVDIAFPAAGPHRLFADFVSAGVPQTLAADVAVAGRYAARPLPAPSARADAGDGYAVAVVAAGSERRFTVERDGVPVEDIEPYLGARGHLVALREGDLAFQHVHPKDRATEGREIAFDVALPGAARHRLFLQFKHGGEVRTAAFTERGGGASSPHGEAGHGH